MKKNLGKIYFIFVCLVVIISSLWQQSTMLIFISSLCGVIYSLLVAKNNKYALYFGIINVSCYGFVLFIEKTYGGFIYNVLYSLPMLIYGAYNWHKSKNKKDNGVKSLNHKTKLILLFFIILSIYMYSLVLSFFGSENILLDSITSVLGYVGIYLLSNKYIEQWNIWIVSNFLNFILWIILAREDISNLPLVFMWSIYLINSIYGYINWNKYKKNIKSL